MIVRLDLECARPTVTNVDDSGILPWSLQNAPAASGQPLEMNARRFIGAVLAPHHAENAELSARWLAPTQQRFDALVLLQRQAVVAEFRE